MTPLDQEAGHIAPRHPGRAGWTPEYRAAVVAAYVAGATHAELARDLHASTASVWKWAKAAGVPPRKGLPPVCHPDQKMWAKGLCRKCYRSEWERNGFVDRRVA